MPGYRPDIPPHVAEIVRHLPPGIKRAVKAAVRMLGDVPRSGEPLQGELEGLMKYRVRRFRIVYAIDARSRVIRIYAIGHRRSVYEELAATLRR